MKHISSYGIEFKNYHSAVKRAVELYRASVNYLSKIVLDNWNEISDKETALLKKTYVECMIHGTSKRTAICDFDVRFPKFPSYLRRSAIADAISAVSSFKSNYKNWVETGSVGNPPVFGVDRDVCPCFYRGNMFRFIGADKAEIKVFDNNDWVWRTVRLKRTDVRYLDKRMRVNKTASLSAPVIEKKHQDHYFLRFTVTEDVELSDKLVFNQRVCAVDLGLNIDATCSVIDVHGTVIARKFINCAREKDSVINALHRVSVFQKLHGSHDSGRLWSVVKRRNNNHANLVSHEIVEFAREQNCDVIVFEYLKTNGRKHGSKKQRLHHWKHKGIQKTTESLAHKYGMRISHVCAWNTSRLAYDGSGAVKRGRAVNENNPYDICQFTSKKMYNCDLSASYNIGARYFIRTLINEFPDITAEVPGIGCGTKRTLSDLWRINKAIEQEIHNVLS